MANLPVRLLLRPERRGFVVTQIEHQHFGIPTLRECQRLLVAYPCAEVLEPILPRASALYAVYPQHRQSSTTVQVFTAFLREQLARSLAA